MARKGMQPKAFLKCAFIFKSSNLVVRNFIYDTMQMAHHIITLRFFYVKTSLEMDRTLNLNSFFENINGQVINAWAVSRSHKTCGMDEIGPIYKKIYFKCLLESLKTIITHVEWLKLALLLSMLNFIKETKFTSNVCLKALKQL